MKQLILACFISLFLIGQALAQIVSSLADSNSRTGSTGITSTVSSVPFGVASASRIITALIFESNGATPTLVTIGGITANVIGNASTGFLCSAAVPTGTSGNITATFLSSNQIFTDGVISLDGASSSIPSSTIVNASGNSGNINVSSGGSIVAYAGVSGAGSWAGVNQLYVPNSDLETGGSFDNSGSPISSRTVGYTTALFIVAAAFDAGSPPPPATLHMLPLLGVGK